MATQKSKVALKLSIQNFITSAAAARRQCFMWTFTFTSKTEPDVAGGAWNGFWTSVKNRFGKLKGVKVTEAHPGGHGVHYHCIVDSYLPMHVLRELGKPWGFGFMWVKRCKGSSAEKIASYVAKYLSKSVTEGWKGVRLWAKLGSWDSVKVADIVVDSILTRCIATFRERFSGPSRIPFVVTLVLRRLSNLWGEWSEWPLEATLELYRWLRERQDKASAVAGIPVARDWTFADLGPCACPVDSKGRAVYWWQAED